MSHSSQLRPANSVSLLLRYPETFPPGTPSPFASQPTPCKDIRRPNSCAGGCGQAFQATIVSPQFAGLNSLKRHRLVNAALKDEIARIHAWTAKCLTPEQWESEAR